MKRTIYLIFLTLFLNLYAQQQFNYKAVYELIYKTDSAGMYLNSDLVLLMKNNENGYFRDYDRFKNDSIKSTEIRSVGAFINEIVTTNNQTKKIKIHRPFDNMNVFYSESIPTVWKLLGTESSINGIKCREATLQAYGRNWNACYSEDYPFQFGPYFFAGLPGLILSVEDDQKFYQFKLMSFKKEDNSIAESAKVKELPKVKFYQMVYEQDFAGKFFNNFRMANPTEHEQFRKKYLEVMKRKNTFPIDKSMRYLFNK